MTPPQARGIPARRSARRSGGRRHAAPRAAPCASCRSRRISICRCRSRRRCRRAARFPWGTVFWSALGGLVALGPGLATTRADRRPLRARRNGSARSARCSPRWRCSRCWSSARKEIVGLLRLASIEKLRARADAALASDDRDEARDIVRALTAKLAATPALAHAPRRTRSSPDRNHRRPRPAAHRRART